MEFHSNSTSKIFKKIQTLLSEQPKLHCPSGKRVSSMCLNSECKTALFCQHQKCKNCLNKHENCNVVQLTSITKEINRWGKRHMQFLTSVMNIDNSMIEKIRQNQEKFFNLYYQNELNIRSTNVVEKIYLSKDGNISGTEAQILQKEIEKLNPKKGLNKKAKDTIDIYQSEIEKISLQIVDFKAKMVPQPMYTRKEEQIVVSMVPKSLIDPTQPKVIDSFILDNSTEELKEQLEFLWNSLNKPTAFKLLFRASEHYFRVKSFHKKCDHIPDTVTLVRTQFGKNIAGYTHYKWNEVDASLKDEQRRTFLLQLDLRQKMIPNNDTSLIFCSKGYGPTFGAGRDLYIADKCNSNNASYAFFPSTYNRQRGEPYVNQQASYRAFSGAEKDKYFSILQYEVFQVLYQPQQQQQVRKQSTEEKKQDSCRIQ